MIVGPAEQRAIRIGPGLGRVLRISRRRLRHQGTTSTGQGASWITRAAVLGSLLSRLMPRVPITITSALISSATSPIKIGRAHV